MTRGAINPIEATRRSSRAATCRDVRLVGRRARKAGTVLRAARGSERLEARSKHARSTLEARSKHARSTLEARSKHARSTLEARSKHARSTLEARSKHARSTLEARSKHARSTQARWPLYPPPILSGNTNRGA
ncbi:hypothetical protein WS72_26100 [Burkholderia savannae]|uniref:Uncharacterized protein n=1 Tax=Burkholderia savannae TaxID=1637837 RepID=A0ABR5T538_9BURK|nr:hypothetical protein WS72_26100 [Burkholderia savannae]